MKTHMTTEFQDTKDTNMCFSVMFTLFVILTIPSFRYYLHALLLWLQVVKIDMNL